MNSVSRSSFIVRLAALSLLCSLATSSALAADQPAGVQDIKHQVTGLFSKERVPDLHKAVEKLTAEKLAEITLVSVDFATAEAVFRYDPAKVFAGATPEQTIERFENLLRQVSRHTFGIKPLCQTPRDQLQLIEIPVAGLDCKACSLAAYEIIYKLDGVEQATASFKDSLVTAWVHPNKTDREKLEAALLARGVTLKDRPQ